MPYFLSWSQGSAHSLRREQGVWKRSWRPKSPGGTWPRVVTGGGIEAEWWGQVTGSGNGARLVAQGSYMACTASSEAPCGRGP